jgi:hypothetical protein
MQKVIGIVAFAVISLTLPQLALAQSSSQGETWSTKHAQVKNELEQAGVQGRSNYATFLPCPGNR